MYQVVERYMLSDDVVDTGVAEFVKKEDAERYAAIQNLGSSYNEYYFVQPVKTSDVVRTQEFLSI